MTQQNAGPDGSIDDDEAERLASMIKPAWETDDDDAAAPAVVAGPAAGSTGPHDTIIEGAPSVRVGNTDPGAGLDVPSEKTVAPEEPAPQAPVAAQATRVGLGSTPTPPLAPEARAAEPIASTEEPKRPSRKSGRESASRDVTAKPVARGAAEAPPRSKRTPVEPAGASYSKFDDPIEIPVRSKPGWLLYGAIGATALAAIIIGVWWMGRTPDATPASSKPAAVATTAPFEKTAEPAKTTEPAKTAEPAAATATAEPSATATAEPSATAKATAAPVATATTKPVATATTKPTSTTKPATTSKPAGGGGIMRDAPF